MSGGHHVLTVVSGFGLRVIPYAPYRMARGPGPLELDVDHESPAGPRFARVIADGEGGYRSKIGDVSYSLHEVVDIEKGPVADDWQLDLWQIRMAFPPGFALHSVPLDSPSPFDLVGPSDSLIFMQSPGRMPALDDMRGPGQAVSAKGEDWIELTYEHDGQPWWQRHQVVGRLAFTAQAPSVAREKALAALTQMVGSLVLAEPS